MAVHGRLPAPAVVLLFIGLLLAPTVKGGSGDAGRGGPIATGDGLWWTDDIRVSNDPSIDQKPQITVDASGNSRVLWWRGGGQVGQVYYKKITRLGNTLIPEKQIATGQPPRNDYFYGDTGIPFMDTDSAGNTWLLTGNYPPLVSTYDAEGNPLATNIRLSSGGTPHAPGGIRVTSEDYGYVVFEMYGGGAPGMITKLKVDGTRVLEGIPVDTTNSYCEGLTLSVDPDNYLHTIMNAWQSSIGGGIILGTLDRNGAKVPGAPLRKLGIGNSGSLPVMANDRAGDTHMVWPSSQSGGTVRYLKADFTNTIVNDQAGGITISTTTTGKPHVVADTKNNAYIFWADTRNGASEIYYMKVKPGLENSSDIGQGKWPDSGVPVRLTFHQGGGQARNPYAAVDRQDNSHVVWEDDRSGDWEIWYKFAFSFGVELNMPPGEMEKVLYVRPNELKVANFTVKNTGGLPDRVFLNLSANFYGKPGAVGGENATRGWWVWLDNYTLELKGQEARKVKMWVRGPESGTDREYIDSTINAISEGNPWKTSTIKFRTYLIINRGLVLKAPLNTQETQPGVPVTYKVTVQNMGDMVEEVLLADQSPAGWKAALDKNQVTVGPKGALNSSIGLNLTVVPPVKAREGQQGVVTVTGRLAAQQAIRSTIVTHTIVGGEMYLVMEAPDTERTVYPGMGTDYEITVTNYGYSTGKALLFFEAVSGTNAWGVTLSTTSLDLHGGEQRTAVLTVIAPPDAAAGERFTVRVRGYNRDRTQEVSAVLVTTAAGVDCLGASWSPERRAVFPGDFAAFQVAVANCGNGPEAVDAQVALRPEGWEVSLTEGSGVVGHMALGAGENRSLTAVVTVPLNAPVGRYESGVRFTGTGGGVREIPLWTEVRQVFAVDLMSRSVRAAGEVGAVLYYPVDVKNGGNGLDTFTLGVEGLPDGWNWEFRDAGMNPVTGIGLWPSSTGRVSLLLTVPRDPGGTALEFSVVAVSAGARENGLAVDDRLKYGAEVLLPDLEFTEIAMRPAAPRAGKVVTLTVVVRNSGPVSAGNVTVSFNDGDHPAGMERFERLPAGANKTATFTWTARGGVRTLTFIADGEGRVAESREDNNIRTQRVDVPGGATSIAPGFEAIALLAGALALALLYRRRPT